MTGECWNTHPVVLRTPPVKKGRSNRTIVRSAIDVKTWLARVPSVDEVRPRAVPAVRGREPSGRARAADLGARSA